MWAKWGKKKRERGQRVGAGKEGRKIKKGQRENMGEGTCIRKIKNI